MTERYSALIVDDTIQYREVLKRMLAGACSVDPIEVADSLDAARAILQQRQFDVVFCDYHFPDGSHGTTLLQEIAASPNPPLTFLITSEPTPDKVKEAQRANVAGVIAKPFNLEEVKRRFSEALARKRLGEASSF